MKKHLILVKNFLGVHSKWFYPLAIVLTAMIVNGVSMCFEDGISNDAVKYHGMIANWIEHRDIFMSSRDSWLATTIPPFFLWVTKCITELLNVAIFTAARIVNFICGAFTPLIFYYLVNSFTEKKKFALFCALTLACHPSVVYISTILTRDCLAFFLVTVVLLFAVQSVIKKRSWDMCVAGLAFAAAALTRYEAGELVLCVLMFLIFCSCGKKISWRRAGGSLFLFVASTVTGMVLWGLLMGFHLAYIEQVIMRYGERFQGFL